jgi:hypothetical protein
MLCSDSMFCEVFVWINISIYWLIIRYLFIFQCWLLISLFFVFRVDCNYLLLNDLILWLIVFITRGFYCHILWINIHYGMIVISID